MTFVLEDCLTDAQALKQARGDGAQIHKALDLRSGSPEIFNFSAFGLGRCAVPQACQIPRKNCRSRCLQSFDQIVIDFKSYGAEEHFAASSTDRQELLCGRLEPAGIANQYRSDAWCHWRRAEGDLDKGPNEVQGRSNSKC